MKEDGEKGRKGGGMEEDGGREEKEEERGEGWGSKYDYACETI